MLRTVAHIGRCRAAASPFLIAPLASDKHWVCWTRPYGRSRFRTDTATELRTTAGDTREGPVCTELSARPTNTLIPAAIACLSASRTSRWGTCGLIDRWAGTKFCTYFPSKIRMTSRCRRFVNRRRPSSMLVTKLALTPQRSAKCACVRPNRRRNMYRSSGDMDCTPIIVLHEVNNLMKADLRCGRRDDALALLEAEIRATETVKPPAVESVLCQSY